MCDRASFDRIVESGGFITAPTGGAPDANLILDPEGRRRRRDGRRRMHRLRCLRRRMPQRCGQPFHRRQGQPSQPVAAGSGRASQPCRGHGRNYGRVLRFVHQPRRVRGRVPEEHLHRLHRPDEQGLPQGQVGQPQSSSAEPDTAVRPNERGHTHDNTQRILTSRVLDCACRLGPAAAVVAAPGTAHAAGRGHRPRRRQTPAHPLHRRRAAHRGIPRADRAPRTGSTSAATSHGLRRALPLAQELLGRSRRRRSSVIYYLARRPAHRRSNHRGHVCGHQDRRHTLES